MLGFGFFGQVGRPSSKVEFQSSIYIPDSGLTLAGCLLAASPTGRGCIEAYGGSQRGSQKGGVYRNSIGAWVFSPRIGYTLTLPSGQHSFRGCLGLVCR